jgi:hypothetical protein
MDLLSGELPFPNWVNEFHPCFKVVPQRVPRHIPPVSRKVLLILAVGFTLGAGIGHATIGFDLNPTIGEAEALSSLHTILVAPDPIQRLRELGQLLPAVEPEAAPALAKTLETSPISRGDPEAVLFSRWWARFDPESAYQWGLSDPRLHFASVVAAVFRVWANRDPETALSRAAALPTDDLRQIANEGVLSGWDESGRPGLEERIRKLPGLEQQRAGEILARRRVVSLGPESAFRWAEDLADPAFRQVMLANIASAAAATRRGARPAAEWAERRIREGRDEGLPRRIGTRWIQHDPVGAMEWLSSLPEGGDREDGVEESFRDWLTRDEVAACEWIQSQKVEPWNEPAFYLYAVFLAFTEPKRAMELGVRLPNYRNPAVIKAGRVWARADRDAAKAWLAQSDLPKEIQDLALLVGRRPLLERKRALEEANEKARAEAEARARAEAGAKDPSSS